MALRSSEVDDPVMDVATEDELFQVLVELTETEPTGEEGLCPWCNAFRAPWTTILRTAHDRDCPWTRLVVLFDRLAAD